MTANAMMIATTIRNLLMYFSLILLRSILLRLFPLKKEAKSFLSL